MYLPSKKNDDFQASLVILIFLLLFMIHQIKNDLIRPQYLVLYSLLLSLLYYKTIINYFKIYRYIILLSLLSFSLSVLKMDKFEIWINSFYTLCLGIIPLLIIRYKISNWVGFIIIGIYSIFVYYSVFILNTGLNEILFNKSRNMVSFYMLCFVVLYDYNNFKNNNKFSFIPALLLCILSLLMIGRGGIITSFLYLAGILFFKYYHKVSISNSLIYTVGIILSILFLSNYYIDYLVEGLVYFNESGFELTGRDVIWLTYTDSALDNTLNFFFGVPLYSESVFVEYDGNLHNSFLSFHSYYGFFIVIFLLLIIYCFFKKNVHMYYKFLLLILLIRSNSDQVFFINLNDFVFYVVFLTILFQKKLNVINND